MDVNASAFLITDEYIAFTLNGMWLFCCLCCVS